ncbi:MAG: ATP-binding protein [Oscillospiraceae bacterium]|nr:ATP-binding protein [Oscillospiraceae bacterium]
MVLQSVLYRGNAHLRPLLLRQYLPERKLDKAQLTRLASCSYIQGSHNVVLLGATGAGKTYIACALGMAASRSFYTVRYIRLPDLLVEIAIARGEGTYREYMKKFRKIKLLILDVWLLYPLKESEARDVLELVEARTKTASTIFCSQMDVPGWHENLYDPNLKDRKQYGNASWPSLQTGPGVHPTPAPACSR